VTNKNINNYFGSFSTQAKKRRYRAAMAKLPRVKLAHLPTPLDECPRSAKELNISKLYIKREDCTGLAFGGNKVRQHEYVLGKAISVGSTCIIQGAASQSNHSRQIAAAGAKLGLRVLLTPKMDQNIDNIQGNYLIDHLLGCEIYPIAASASSTDEKNKLAQKVRSEGEVPYISGMGATDSLILGALACVEIIFEISDALADWDKRYIDGAVVGVGKVFLTFSDGFRRLQSGVVGDYALFIVIGTIFILFYVFFKGA
jgi:1-aminocyclopropane-1-carboxylate deaminase/D-cysteine desulfhydrase-like pyridoxal-dependent ACC family enzyme